MSPLPAVEHARDYQALAQARLAESTWRYLCEGDSQGNEAALSNVRLTPRPLRRVSGGHTGLTLFGQTLEHPIVLAPIAYQRLFHPDGEVASAMAAAAQGGQMVISSLASLPLETIAAAGRSAGSQGPWFQLYWQNDRARTLRLLRQAIDAGCSSVVFTVDAPIKLASLQLPSDVGAVNLEAAEAPPVSSSGTSVVFDGWMAQAPTWDDLDWLRRQTSLPLLVKGLLHPDDAERAMACGCDGIVVSNHGGRVLRGATLSLAGLGPIVERINGRIPVLFDSGVRCGRDVFVALAHGASAVLVGRPYVWGLASHGAMGVAHVIRLLRDELEMTMALMGCAALGEIEPLPAFS